MILCDISAFLNKRRKSVYLQKTPTSGGGYPLAKHLSSTSCPSTTTTERVELSEMIGGRRTISGTSAVSLSVNEIRT